REPAAQLYDRVLRALLRWLASQRCPLAAAGGWGARKGRKRGKIRRGRPLGGGQRTRAGWETRCRPDRILFVEGLCPGLRGRNSDITIRAECGGNVWNGRAARISDATAPSPAPPGTRRALASRSRDAQLTWRNSLMLLPIWIAIGSAVAFLAYVFVGYPLALRAFASLRRRERPEPVLDDWPEIRIAVAAYNEAGQIRELIENLLELDYPADRRQILVISDASTDGTDDIVREYADRGVELIRLPERRGKTAAENFGRRYLRGRIIVNTDASVRIGRDALRRLVAQFADPTVGVASGRDVSVTRVDGDANLGVSGYVG